MGLTVVSSFREGSVGLAGCTGLIPPPAIAEQGISLRRKTDSPGEACQGDTVNDKPSRKQGSPETRSLR